MNRIDPMGRQAILVYEANVSITRGERVAVGKLEYEECKELCKKGCDDVIAEHPLEGPQFEVNFLILCYLTCDVACRSIYPSANRQEHHLRQTCRAP